MQIELKEAWERRKEMAIGKNGERAGNENKFC